MRHHPDLSTTCRALLAGIAVGAAAALAGCGSDADGQPVTRPATVTLQDADPASGVYLIEGARSVGAGAVRISVRNRGTEERGAQLIGVQGRHGVAEAFAALNEVGKGAPMPSWLRWAGGIGVVRPGSASTFTVDLRPGSYYVVDRSFEGKPTELTALEQSARLEVRQGGDDAALATPRAAITAAEYSFRTRGLTASDEEVLLENRGAEPHDFVLSPIVRGRTLDDVKAFATGEDESGPPPVDFENEVISGVLEGGTRQTMRLGLKAGQRYALICFASDRRGGPPHVAKGMVAEVDVGAR